jgi:hypothetical protein
MKENKSRIEIARKVAKDTVKVSDIFKEYGRFIDPVWRGEGEWMIACAFHGDLSPSLGINDKLGSWNCFGCEAKGDVFTALRWLAKSVDHAYYSYAEAIDQLIKRNAVFRESLPFNTVFEKTLTVDEIMNRPKLKYKSEAAEIPKTMNDVYLFMQKSGKTSFIDIAYATSMMVARQEPEQILAFMGAGQITYNQTQVKTEKSEVTAADLLAELDDWGSE